jgi:autoinducer 2-degrading protein
MLVTCVHVFVKPDHLQDFIEATLKNHAGTRQEPGNLRFDVLQVESDPTHFMLYEVFESTEASAQHKQTAHYLAWRNTVAAWMEKPREGVPCRVLAPLDRGKW